jgi:hypothetical protein
MFVFISLFVFVVVTTYYFVVVFAIINAVAPLVSIRLEGILAIISVWQIEQVRLQHIVFAVLAHWPIHRIIPLLMLFNSVALNAQGA